MQPELWRQAEELFHAALEQSPVDRRAFLDSACGQDTELRRHVDLLVSAEENAGSFLDKAGAADLIATIRASGSLMGQQLGHYRIVSPLGVGGMGESTGRTTPNSVAMSPLKHCHMSSLAIVSVWPASVAKHGRWLR